MTSVKIFIKNLYNGDYSFSFSSKNKISNLYSTCFGVMCLDLIGELDKFKDKEKITKYIQNYQDKKTGYFIDKTAISKNKTTHNQEYINLQLTDFSQMALSALNKKPLYKYIFLEKYKNKDYLENWLYKLNWNNPWLVSNFIMFILNCLIYENEKENKECINLVVNWLIKNQNPQNGYWNLGRKVSYHNQMAGAYHFLFFYTYSNKKPSYINKIINSTLSLQNYDGLFNYYGGGGSCDDLDAIDLLCRTTFYTNYKKDEIKKALEKTYKSLIKNQNKDGGFCWAKTKIDFKDFLYLINLKLLYKTSFLDFIKNASLKIKKIINRILKEQEYWNFSGLKSMKIKKTDSDLFSTWFRLTSVAFIETTFPEISVFKKTHKWNLRKKCGLGFYKK